MYIARHKHTYIKNQPIDMTRRACSTCQQTLQTIFVHIHYVLLCQWITQQIMNERKEINRSNEWYLKLPHRQFHVSWAIETRTWAQYIRMYVVYTYTYSLHSTFSVHVNDCVAVLWFDPLIYFLMNFHWFVGRRVSDQSSDKYNFGRLFHFTEGL